MAGGGVRYGMMSALERLFEMAVGGTPCRLCLWDLASLTESHPDLKLDMDRYVIHNSPYCIYAKSTAYGQNRCLRCKSASMWKALKKGTYIGMCHMGLSELVFPLRFGNRLVGLLEAGQVVAVPGGGLSPAALRHKASHIGLNPGRLVRLYRLMPRVSLSLLRNGMRERLDVVARFIQGYHRAEAARALLRVPDRAPVPQEHPALRGPARREWLSNCGIEIARREYNRSLRTERVAERLRVPVAVFCQAFRKHAGKTFKDYLNEVRVDAAKRLLIFTGSSITYVALETGFPDPNYFSRVFTRVAGMNPRSYRDKYWRPRGRR